MDRELRSAERSSTGTEERARLLRQRVRAGILSPELVRLGAYFGDRAACEATGFECYPWPTGPETLREWVSAVYASWPSWVPWWILEVAEVARAMSCYSSTHLGLDGQCCRTRCVAIRSVLHYVCHALENGRVRDGMLELIAVSDPRYPCHEDWWVAMNRLEAVATASLPGAPTVADMITDSVEHLAAGACVHCTSCANCWVLMISTACERVTQRVLWNQRPAWVRVRASNP